MLAKTLVIQCSPCYSAVSALLTNPLPDRSNYSLLLSHPLPHCGSIHHRSLRPDPLPSRSAGKQYFTDTAAALYCMTYSFNYAFYKLVKTMFWCLISNLSYPEDLMKQRLHRRPSFSSNFLSLSLFSILSLLTFSILSLLIPSYSSDQFSVPLR